MEHKIVSDKKMTKNTGKKKTLFDLLKEHKTVIEIVVLVGLGMVIFTTTKGLNIEASVAKGLKTLGDAISGRSGGVEACHAWNLPSNKPINVSEHLRNLPDGWKPSQIKIDLATRYGFSLGDHQTWVDSYVKKVA